MLGPEWFRVLGDHPGSLKLLEQMRALIVELDQEQRIAYVTPNVESVTGHLPEELIGCLGEVLVHPDDRSLFEVPGGIVAGDQRALRYRARHKSGHWIWIETAGATEFTAGDGTVHSVSFSRDVTELKEAEIAARASDDRYRAVVESSEDVVYEGDESGHLIFVTPNIETVLGYTPDEIAARDDAFATIHPDDVDRVRVEYGRALQGSEPVRMHYRVMHKDGTTRYFHTTGLSYLHPSGASHFLNVTRDVTPALEALSKQRDLESRLQQAQRLESLGVMAGGVAHDFNNLLTPVIADASLALADLPADSPVRFRIERIQRTGERAAELTRQMLAYAGADEIETESVDVSVLVAEVSGLIEERLANRIAVTRDLAPDLPIVEGDPGQLTQVILNLLTNAEEAVGPGGGVIVIRTGVSEQTSGGSRQFPEDLGPGRYVFLEVEDDGCGMDDETRARIFDPFFTTKFTGRGLGLASVLGILRAHDGAIEIDSHLGRGTKFKVVLPVASARSARLSADPPAVGGPSASRRKVLVIDDDDGTREITSDCLERAGMRVLLAAEGEAGVEQFRQYADEIAVVILDRTMPGVSGEEVFDRIRAIRPGVKILLMSGYAEGRASEAFAGRQLSGFIGKPFLPEELLAAVQRITTEIDSESP